MKTTKKTIKAWAVLWGNAVGRQTAKGQLEVFGGIGAAKSMATDSYIIHRGKQTFGKVISCTITYSLPKK